MKSPSSLFTSVGRIWFLENNPCTTYIHRAHGAPGLPIGPPQKQTGFWNAKRRFARHPHNSIPKFTRAFLSFAPALSRLSSPVNLCCSLKIYIQVPPASNTLVCDDCNGVLPSWRERGSSDKHHHIIVHDPFCLLGGMHRDWFPVRLALCSFPFEHKPSSGDQRREICLTSIWGDSTDGYSIRCTYPRPMTTRFSFPLGSRFRRQHGIEGQKGSRGDFSAYFLLLLPLLTFRLLMSLSAVASGTASYFRPVSSFIRARATDVALHMRPGGAVLVEDSRKSCLGMHYETGHWWDSEYN